MEQKMKVVASLDLAIMLDCTGSMYAYLENAKSQIYDFVDSIGRIYPDIPLKINIYIVNLFNITIIIYTHCPL